MVLLIGYDLNGHERPAAYARIKKLIEDGAGAANFIKALYSQWFVDTSGTPQQWQDYLTGTGGIDKDDRLFILQVRRPYYGYLDQAMWDWLNGHLVG